MKTLIVWFLVVAVAGCTKAEPTKDIKKFADECAAEHKVDLKEWDNMMKEHFAKADGNFKCFNKCTFEKMEALKSGTLVEKGFVESFPNHRLAKHVFKLCSKDVESQAAANDCEKSFNFFMCIVDFVPLLKKSE